VDVSKEAGLLMRKGVFRRFNMRKKLRTVIMGSLLVGIIVGMAGCSGGGGSNSAVTFPYDPPPPPPSNTPPVAANDTAVTAMNTPIDIAVLANDSDHDGDPLTVTTVSPVSHGTVYINSVGTVHYIPTTGFMGLDSFTYSIADGRGGVTTAAVSITVTFPSGLPVERVSVATSVTQDNSNSWMGAISLDGRYVVYRNNATDLYTGVIKGNILLRDRLTSQTILVSSDKTGISGNQSSQQPVLSGDGSYIAFSSFASNLVPGDTNGTADVFVKNVLTGNIERVSVASDGSQGDGENYAPSISADGRYVAFLSTASNFFPGDSASSWDIFIHDRQTGQTKHVDSGVHGGDSNNGPSISGDGRYVAYAKTVIESPIFTSDPFYSGTHVFIYDQQTGGYDCASNYYVDGTLGLLFFSGDGASGYPSISGNGRYVAYTSLATNLVSGDTNGVRDVFVYDRSLIFNTQIPRVSVASDGTQGNGAVTDLERPSISSDGRFVAFSSSASNLMPTDTNGFPDTFVHDMATGQTLRVSVSASGLEANGSSSDGVLVSISANGGYVVFSSGASNLVPGDTNGYWDVFVAPNPLVH
jgi:Tol biopolymer transport system component